jgi:hypothetical protein
MNSLFHSFGFDGPSKTANLVSERSQAPVRPAPAAENGEEAPRSAGSTFDERQAMTRRRSAALRAMFPKVFSWFAGRWDFDTISDASKYLEQSTNLADLELRIRHIEQKRHFGF